MTRTLIAILRLSSQNVSLVQKESLTHCNIHLDMEEGEEFPHTSSWKPQLTQPILHIYPRICPGRDLALQLLFLATSMMLATLDIGTACDENGHEIIPKCEFTTGGLS